MRKFFNYLFVFLLVLGIFTFAGCKKKDKDPKPTPNPDINVPEPDPDPEPEPDPEPVVKEYNISWYDYDGTLLATNKVKENETPSYQYTLKDSLKDDYIFKGWSKAKDGELTTIAKATEDTSYYAILEQIIKYNVKFVDADNNTLSEQTIKAGEDAKAPKAPDKKGHTFTGWDKAFTNVQGDLIVKPIFKVNKYSITFVSNGGTAIAKITEDYGTSIAEPAKPEKKGFKFVAWSYDEACTKKVTWPLVLEEDLTLYASYNEVINIKAYLKTMMDSSTTTPMAYIPNAMRYTDTKKLVQESEVSYTYENYNNISSFKFGGFGPQWNMVIDNIHQSENFYNVLTIAEDVINSSVVAFNNYLDKNPSTEASHELKETTYTASLLFKDGILIYKLQYKTNLHIPLFGDITPVIEMVYDTATSERAVKILLNAGNVIKYSILDSSYVFGIQYGIKGVERKAYCQLNKDEENNVSGHIYEFITALDKVTISSCADFYITDKYTTAVGNKADGLPGFKGYVNELYETNVGKLLGHEVREELTIAGVHGQYNTLWFNLNDIQGISNIKLEKNSDQKAHNPNIVYVNNSSTVFTPMFNKKLGFNTSRKFDIELRPQYFYSYDSVEDKYIEHKVDTPMMFIQQGENFDSFVSDIKATNGITAKVLLAKAHLDKIIADYSSLIDIFIGNKDKVTPETITTWLAK